MWFTNVPCLYKYYLEIMRGIQFNKTKAFQKVSSLPKFAPSRYFQCSLSHKKSWETQLKQPFQLPTINISSFLVWLLLYYLIKDSINCSARLVGLNIQHTLPHDQKISPHQGSSPRSSWILKARNLHCKLYNHWVILITQNSWCTNLTTKYANLRKIRTFLKMNTILANTILFLRSKGYTRTYHGLFSLWSMIKLKIYWIRTFFVRN